ncbi:hypothetical protein SAG0066_01075 [Streptococcus agalactiae CCUG 38383]|nr:hypothetical protein SAG0066_01075 [Streptococcus agalactiae CCUG 38383]
MGIFSGLMGNASQMDTDKVENQLSDILISDEQVDLAYTLIRDLIVFTNYRLILVDKQGVTGKKVSYNSIPYASSNRTSRSTSV